MVSLSYRIPEDIKKVVEDEAKKKGVSQSLYVRYVLAGFTTLTDEEKNKLYKNGIEIELNERG